MKSSQIFRITIVVSYLVFNLACSNDKVVEVEEEPIMKVVEGTQGKAEYFNLKLTHQGYILVNDALDNSVYLMDKNADLIHEWDLKGHNIGNDAYLLPNGKLLVMLEAEDPKIELGGLGGKIQLLDKEGNVEWNFDYSSENYIMHHDAEMLPNGNVIVQVWRRKTVEEAQMAGSNLEIDLFPDSIIEVNPSTDEIVWEWNFWDHLIQDFDDTKNNFGSIADNPQLVDLNYVSNEKGSVTHANGIAYDATNDLIFLSINFYSEIWVIDHSTSTLEAASHAGGNYNKGGDLIYRFGNPEAYGNTKGQRLFDHNHYPNLMTGEDKGNILVYSNGFSVGQSTAYELKLPETFSLQPNQDNEPSVVWSFTDEELFSPKVSSVVRLPNGNTMITEGDFGIWEVTSAGEVVWQFSEPGFFWRAYSYETDDPAIIALQLSN